MRARFAPLRRLGAILFGVLMMHTSWMAATASCDGPALHQGATAQAAHASHTAEANAHAHHHAPPADLPAPHHDHDDASRTSCPMAMACTLSVVAAALPTVDVVTVALATALPTFVADAPHWALVAPEPPPPRG